jgi:nucleoside-diphosphate-sugar epimerase
VLAVRAADSGEFIAKREALSKLLADARADRITIVPVDLRDEAAFDVVADLPVTTIVHRAAVTRFNVDDETAKAVNVAETARVFEFARHCGQLSRVLMLWTVYSAPSAA